VTDRCGQTAFVFHEIIKTECTVFSLVREADELVYTEYYGVVRSNFDKYGV
jgi:hypothetical protein